MIFLSFKIIIFIFILIFYNWASVKKTTILDDTYEIIEYIS